MVRWLVALLLIAPFVQAAPDDSFSLVLVDPLGSPALSHAGIQPEFDQLDILQLQVGPETVEEIPFKLTLADSGDPLEGSPYGGVARMAFFSYSGLDHRISHAYSYYCEGVALERRAAESWEYAGCGKEAIEQNSFTWTIPKRLIKGIDGAPVAHGGHLENIHASAVATLASTTGATRDIIPYQAITVADRVPDAGFGLFELAAGGGQSTGADFRLHAQKPIRATNGGAETIEFNVQILGTHRPGESWTINVEADATEFEVHAPDAADTDSSGSAEFTVHVKLLGQHHHDVTRMFQVRATDATGESAWADLGVHWLSTPQPGDHHPRLWFHSAPPQVQPTPASAVEYGTNTLWQTHHPWMNTLEADERPGATDEPVAAEWEEVGSDVDGTFVMQYRWQAELDPSLVLGMAFEPGQAGRAWLDLGDIPVHQSAMTNVSFGVCGPGAASARPVCDDKWLPLATHEEFHADGLPTAWALDATLDYASDGRPVPFAIDQRLFVVIQLDLVNPASDVEILTPTWLVDSSWLEMPFAQYSEGEFVDQTELLTVAHEAEPTASRQTPAPAWAALSLVAVAWATRRR